MTRRRAFLAGATSLAASALGVLPAFANSGDQLGTPDDPCLPPTHFGYEFIQTLAQWGFDTGLPDGYFAGKFPVSRQKFVWTIRAIFSQLPYYEGAGAVLMGRRRLNAPRMMRTMARELIPEFSSQGVTELELQSALNRFERLWLSPFPRGVTDPVELPAEIYGRDPLWPLDWRARAAGARLAREEWHRGAARLYVAEPAHFEADTPNAVPLHYVPEAGTTPYNAQLLLGHNAEMWRLLRTMGAPKNSKYGWTRDLFRLRAIWTQPRQTVIALRNKRQYTSPDGEFKFDGTEFLPTSKQPNRPRDRCDLGATMLRSDFYRLLRPFALLWGEAGSGVAYLRCHGWNEDRNPVRLLAVDLRTGIILNAAVA